MITIACLNCHHALRVDGDPKEVDMLVGQQSDFWSDNYTCFVCGGKAQGYLTPEIGAAAFQSLSVVNVTPQEAYAALMGLGVPDEHTCCIEVLEPLFAAHGIKLHARQQRGLTRVFVDVLEFDDGTKVFLGTSPQGAVVYRISKRHSYLKAMESTGAA